jgi:uncharacterized protein (DUF3084 family)
MTTGYILIASIFILGGMISIVGGSISSRVYSRNLSLLSLSPSRTAIILSFLTGSLISASTLLILLAADDGLRKSLWGE